MIQRMALIVGIAVCFPVSAVGTSAEAVQYLKAHGQPPADYVLAKTLDHRVVLLGEAHWNRHDVELVIDLVSRLSASGVDAVALEMLPASEQATLDRILAADTWDESAALRIMRTAAWPYREYLEILHAAWKHNHGLPPNGKPLKLIALSPPTDWREQLLPRGDTYDRFMARLLLDFLKRPERKVLVYAGRNHAFTRYYQAELPREKRVEKFMDRMGNILWRELGEDVFLILLQSSWPCRVGEKWDRCLPVGGKIDCAAASGGRPVGFDLVSSPFADLPVPQDSAYAPGYPALRLGDMADGYIWNRPIEEFSAVSLIPLAELAPDAASLAEAAQNNPFDDRKGLGRAELQDLWDKESERLRNFQKSSGLERLFAWRRTCEMFGPRMKQLLG